MRQDRVLLPEIQGLRALAVGLVLIFHIWPSALSGGYVGVDVFFVISGYLITGLLVRAAEREGRISLIDFYSQRARRLLPAATTVLGATFGGMFALLPQPRWEETAIQIGASALYVQNWLLAWLSVDYLAAEDAASPTQHYWSLSIEEQFYFVWPLVMIGAISLAPRLGLSLRRTFIVALSVIFAGSLAASVLLTAREPASAYFVTHTRMWELALGGLLALTNHRIRWLLGGHVAVAIVGLGAIVWSAFVYKPSTAFPGAAALVPTLGAAAVILAGDVRLGFFRGLNARWLTWIGDRSYSIYLWHWPLVCFYMVSHDRIGLMDGVGLIALTLVLSHFSYEHIEQRFRHSREKGEWKPIGYGLASIAVCLLATGATQRAISSQAVHVEAGDPRYPGPSALLSSATTPENVEPVPPLSALKSDLPVVYGEKCHQDQQSAEPVSCILGDPNGARTMVILGDSHAAQWVPALDVIAKEGGWKLVTLTKSACSFSRVEIWHRNRPYLSCTEWRENAIRKIKAIDADIVFMSQSRYSSIDHETMANGLRSVWSELLQTGMRVIPIHDTPWLPFQPEDCLAHGEPKECTVPREKAEASNIFAYAARAIDGVEVVDLTDGICGPETCDAIVGNLIVWRDEHHLTATYSTALAPYMAGLAGLPVPNRASAPAATAGVDAERTMAARLVCGALPGDRAFDRELRLQVENGRISYSRGDWKKKEKHYDLWSGAIEGDLVIITGHYIEGTGGMKEVSLSGRISNGRLVLEGARGPRKCTLSALWVGGSVI